MSVSFAGITLTNAEPPATEPDILLNKTRLQSGKIKLVGSSQYGLKYSFTCHITSLTEYNNLLGLIGTPGTLTVDNDSYSNMMIETLTRQEDGINNWTYKISFQRDTSS